MSDHITRRRFLGTSVAAAGMAAVAPAAALATEESVLPVRPLGKTGMMPTLFGFGGGSRYLSETDEAVAERILHRAIELGVRYFDTAYSYGADQLSLRRYGRYLVPQFRDQILIASKTQARDAEAARREVDRMLEALGTDHLDVLHFHAIGNREEVDEIMSKGGAYEVFAELKDSGVIRAIGVTGHADSGVLVYAMEQIEPDCIMCPQNPGHADASGRNGISFGAEVTPYALQHGIGVLAMKTTGQDNLIGKENTSAADLVRYAMSLPVASAIIGMPTLDILEMNADIARNLRPMSEEELDDLRGRLISSVDMERTVPYLAEGYVDGCPQSLSLG